MLNKQFCQNIPKHLFNILLMPFVTFHYSFVQMFLKYFTNVFPMVIEPFANVLFMFILNVSDKKKSVLLKIFAG